jgi:hypothetical protein
LYAAKRTEKEVKAYLQKFIDKYGSLDDGADNWVDQIFKGEQINAQTIVQVKK